MSKNPKILIIALSGIGDALMFTPAVKLIRDEKPNAKIDVLVMFKGVKDIYERLELADRIIYFDFMKQGAVNSLKFVFSLRNKYDYSINVYPSNRKEYNIISFLIGAKNRGAISYLRSNIKEMGFLNTCTVKENDELHNVEENIKITEKILKIKANSISPLLLVLNTNDREFAENYILNNSLTDELIVGIHAGCSLLKNHIKRRWEPEKFVELIKQLITEKNAKVLLFGGPDEEELNEFICKSVNSVNLYIPKSKNLTESAALIQKCKIFISNDSGLMHIAAAMQVVVIPIIGPTSLNYIKPWLCKHEAITLNLECSPCFIYSPKPLSCTRKDIQFKCIKELTVDKAVNVINKYI
ncbi:MAG TPA: glycosyltransferase family 9 protein [Melioribacteraceae bacterium]|nr:glycosyltransferase family 9 protein [Melioribacteraceae bacterium]